MTANRILPFVLMAGVLGLAIAWWLTTHRLVDVDIALPPTGKAARNELHALKLALEAMEHDVVLAKRIDEVEPLDPADTLVLQAEASTLRDVDVEGIVEFVEAGGRLVYAPPYDEEDALAAALGFRPGEWQGLSFRRPNGKEGWVSGLGLTMLDDEADVELRLAKADAEGAAVLRFRHGEGTVLAMSSLQPFTNRGLEPLDRIFQNPYDDEPADPKYTGANDANIEFAWQLLAPMIEGRRVVLLDAMPVIVDPLWKILARDAWPIVVPLVLALLAWLWLRSVRLGPVQQSLATDRRSLIEHVQAAGEFAFRRGRALALHAAAKRAYKAKLERVDPVLASLDDDRLAEALATRHARPVGEIRQALNPVDVARPATFTATIRTLMELRAHL